MSLMSSIVNSVEFNKLASIGGHKIYHLEGSALTHSLMVFEEACEMFPRDYEMQIIALLHDIGKIYTSVCNGPDDWSYPNHAKAGAENLHKFLIEEDDLYKRAKWYISNHIKPLFWRGKDLRKEIAVMDCPEGCSIIKLAKLVVCDIKGSVSTTPQTELLAFLHQFIEEGESALKKASEYCLENEVLYLINQGYTPKEALTEWDLL